MWTPTFFRRRALVTAAILCGLIWATAVAVFVLLGIEGAWWAFGFWGLYPLWCTYALALSICWARWGPGEEKRIAEATMGKGY
jgi:hypothetical protein